MTVIAFRTDATTVLERLALYEIKKAGRSEWRNYFSKKRYGNDNEAVA